MPRFEASSAACLKRVMSTRSPHFVLSPVDVEAVMKETGLSRAQVMVWTDNFRCRYKSKSVEQVLEYLKRNEEVTILSVYLGKTHTDLIFDRKLKDLCTKLHVFLYLVST
jgi:hypothetical protein